VSKLATRTRILDGALDVFARKGYHRAIVDDIVRASGTSKGAVHHHFPNKEALFIALVGAVNEIVVQWLHGAVPDLGGTIPALTRMLLRSIGSPAWSEGAPLSLAPRTPSGSRRRGSRG
jgi:AcrR family transcriptional regulator